MKRSTFVCGLTCVAVLAGTAFAQHGRSGGSHGGSGGGHHVSGGGHHATSGGHHTTGGGHHVAGGGHHTSGSGAHPGYRPPTPASYNAASTRITQSTTRPGAVAPTQRPRVTNVNVKVKVRVGGGRGGLVTGGDDGGAAYGTAGETGDSAVATPEYGVKITCLFEGTAARQGLREGDIILSFNGTATPTLDDLITAVQQSPSEAEVVFLNVENGQRESMRLYPDNARIGVEGVSVPVE